MPVLKKNMEAVMKGLQSKDEIPLDKVFEVNVITLRNRIGSGCSAVSDIERDSYSKKVFLIFFFLSININLYNL